MGRLKEGKLEQQPQIVQGVYKFLSTKSNLWAFWTIAGDDKTANRLMAAQWLVEQVKGVAKELEEEEWIELWEEANEEAESD